MAVYRFLFAPALLVVAVLAGSGERAGVARQGAAALLPEVRSASAAAGPAIERASAAKPAARPATRAERARAHPVP